MKSLGWASVLYLDAEQLINNYKANRVLQGWKRMYKSKGA